MLDALKEICNVQSEVRYANLWHEGKPTTIQNGDHFLHMDAQDVCKVPQQIEICGAVARIFKPAMLILCKRCGQEGHHPSDTCCPARATEIMAETVETFRGGKSQLSNLHICPEGCKIQDAGTTFLSGEHHYQFKKVKHHDLSEEAYLLLTEEDSFKAIKKAESLLPPDKLSDQWKEYAYEEMLNSNKLKYQACEHVRNKLLSTKLTIAEATGNKFWGTGLNPVQTKECLMDY